MIVYPTLVQGSSAHFDIIEKLKLADANNHDTIILARGGGSIEDLWAFNEEELARVIFDLKTPIVSGVGHEIDFTISDFVSDLRAPTPTAAAEITTPNIIDVKLLINNLNNSIIEKTYNIINISQQKLDYYTNKPVYLHPNLLLLDYKEKLSMYSKNLNTFKDIQLNKINNFNNLKNNFIKNINEFIYNENIRLNNLNNTLNNSIKNYNKDIRNNFVKQLELMQSYSPINTLKRGYSMIEVNNKVVSSIQDLQVNDSVNISLKDGKVKAKIVEKEIYNGEF